MTKNTRITIGVIAALVIIGIIWITVAKPSAPVPQTNTQTNIPPRNNETSALTPSPATTVTTPTTPTPNKTFSIVATDSASSISVIRVKKGDVVRLNFTVGGTVYHGGLDFRSPIVSTGTILPLGSKSVTFTATKSFTLTPYWPDTNTRKNYTISVVVE